ncbi:MAG: hypothetical protein J6W13_11835 [Salinivirgaceae bacterium]|nr:hypothetical protein [Salinivirgaceae bacterium]
MDTVSAKLVKSIVIDSVEYIKKSDVLNFYSDIADKQATQFTILISVLCGIVVILLGATWWWNYRAAKQQIRDDINTEKIILSKILRKKMNEMDAFMDKQNQRYNSEKEILQNAIEKKINLKYEQTNADIKLITDEYKKELIEEINNHKNSVDHQIKEDQANINRIFALHSDFTGLYYIASTWWLSAAENYKEIGNDYFFGLCIDRLKASLYNCKDSELDIIGIEDLKSQIKKVENIVPILIKKEKDEIINRLKELIKIKQIAEKV